MPINNKGRLNLSEVVRRQVDKDWPAANTDFDLFVQDLIASGNLIANGLIIRNIEVSDNILTGNITVSSITANTLVLDILTANTGIFENITINGDLTVEGNTVTLNTATLTVEDKNIRIANGAADAATADGAGITIDGAGANITYEASGDKLVINKTLNVQGDVNTTGNLIGNGLIIRNIEVSDSILTGNVTATTITANVLTLDIITANTFNGLPAANLDLLTTDDLNEGSSNFYFTIPRARTAYSGGLGIAISANGVISAKGDDTGTGMFNSGINLAEALLVTDSFSNIHVFTAEEGDSFIVYSLHATNITDSTAFLTARTVINDGANTVLFANLMQIPGTSSMELLRKPQVFKPGDQLQFQSFDSSGAAAGDRISVMMSYQASTDENYERSGITLENDTASEIFVTAGRTSIVESIRLVNHDPEPARVSVYWANATDVLFAWIASNISIPPHSSLEICEYPKSLPENYKIMARKA